VGLRTMRESLRNLRKLPLSTYSVMMKRAPLCCWVATPPRVNKPLDHQQQLLHSEW